MLKISRAMFHKKKNTNDSLNYKTKKAKSRTKIRIMVEQNAFQSTKQSSINLYRTTTKIRKTNKMLFNQTKLQS